MRMTVLILAALATACGKYRSHHKDEHKDAQAEPAQAEPAPPVERAPVTYLDPMTVLTSLTSFPHEMQVLHRLAVKMHNATSECAGFAEQERAELATFDELAAAGTPAAEARQKLQPFLDAVRATVVPNLLEALQQCRLDQRPGPDNQAMEALMLACFELRREDLPAGPGGSTPFGDPLRMPDPASLKPSDACTAAVTQAEALL